MANHARDDGWVFEFYNVKDISCQAERTHLLPNIIPKQFNDTRVVIHVTRSQA